jgi:uncharacterized protein YciI
MAERTKAMTIYSADELRKIASKFCYSACGGQLDMEEDAVALKPLEEAEKAVLDAAERLSKANPYSCYELLMETIKAVQNLQKVRAEMENRDD